jgi:hypothetical protein
MITRFERVRAEGAATAHPRAADKPESGRISGHEKSPTSGEDGVRGVLQAGMHLHGFRGAGVVPILYMISRYTAITFMNPHAWQMFGKIRGDCRLRRRDRALHRCFRFSIAPDWPLIHPAEFGFRSDGGGSERADPAAAGPHTRFLNFPDRS